jgi:hypothetical protein
VNKFNSTTARPLHHSYKIIEKNSYIRKTTEVTKRSLLTYSTLILQESPYFRNENAFPNKELNKNTNVTKWKIMKKIKSKKNNQ